MDLINKYRPEILEDVFGQEHVTKSISVLFKENKIPHSFLFTGNSGTGKTTLARIVANELKTGELIEIDAATHNGVEPMKNLCQGLRYGAHGKNNIKFVILDEFHRCSLAATESLLKIIEEPPKHLYFAFCTTELNKVPKTIQTRCTHYNLKDVGNNDLFDLIKVVAKEENINLEDSSIMLIARQAFGSPRRALSYLGKCRGAENERAVQEILELPLEDGKIIDLCKELVGRNPTWYKIIKLLKTISAEPEAIRITIFNYCSACVLNSKTEQNALKFLAVMENFSHPIYNSSTGKGELLMSIADTLRK